MLKFSIYNEFFETRTQSVLYNCFTDELIVLLPEVLELILNSQSNFDTLSQTHPDLYKTLIKKGMLIDDNTDESKNVIETWKKTDINEEKFHITINPTLDCNLKCWYCYEKHSALSVMSAKTKDSIKKFINNKVKDNKIKFLRIDFFGGEPLMYFYETVLPILDYAKQRCIDLNKKLAIGFTTNAVLITEDIISELKKYKIHYPPFFQITLDGNRSFHNSTRYMKDGSPTYDIIINNIKKCAEAGFKVLIRFNYTNENAISTIDVIDEFQNCDSEIMKNITFSFHQVWQNRHCLKTEKSVTEIKNIYRKKSLNVSHSPTIEKFRCYADKTNHVVINYNGDLYKCTARDFTKENREGVLNEDGILEWNDKYRKRMEIVNGNNTICRKCSIFPICAGQCSQKRLEYNFNECIMKYSKEDKKELIRNRIKMLFDI